MNTTGEVVNVLVADVSPNHAEECAQQLRETGLLLHCEHAGDRESIARRVAAGGLDVVIHSSRLGDPDCCALVTLLAANGCDAPVLVVYDAARVEPAVAVVDAIRAGARDAVSRANPGHLRLVLLRELGALRERRLRRRAQADLAERERRWQALMEGARDPVAYVHGGMHVHSNASYLHMFGYERPEEIEGLPLMDLIVPEHRDRVRDALRQEGPQQLETEVVRADGGRIAVRLELAPACYDDEACWQLMLRDQSERLAIRAQLDYLRDHDPLTGLYNRDRLLQSLAAAEAPSALLCVELDNYHLMRDSFGITALDRLVVDVAAALRGCLPDRAELSRVGDNVFGVLHMGADGEAGVELAERLRTVIEEHVTVLDERSVSSTCSVGVAIKTEPRTSVEGLLRRVQEACAMARAGGGNRVVRCRDPQPAEAPECGGERLGKALADGRLQLVFQPIVNLDDVSMEIFEVLLRAHAESGEPLSTAALFDGALSDEIAAGVDRWVLARTLDLLGQRVAEGHATRLFVNVTVQSLASERFIEHLAGLLLRSGVPPERLVLEIAESSAVTRVREVKTLLAALRELGCGYAIEHFGAGLSSPSTLRQLPFEFVKLHPSLVQGLGDSAEAEATLHAIVEVSRELHRPVIAFGVEQPETLARLWSLGVSYAQGLAVQAPAARLDWTYSNSELA